MALESRNIWSNSPWFQSSINGDSVESRTSLFDQFVVSPSPCRNTGGPDRLPSPYTFSSTRRYGVVGYEKYQGWGRVIGDSSNQVVLITTNFHGCAGLGYQGLDPNLLPSESLRDLAYNKALAKLYDKVRNAEVSLNTSLGEGRETFEMLHSIARRFRSDKYRSLHKGLVDLNDALRRDPRGTVSSGWLGWHVGWKPFLQDIHNIFNHFTTLQTQPHADFIGREKVRASAQNEQRWTESSGIEHFKSESHRFELQMSYRVSDLALFNTWQLGLTVRPTLAWELTRLSFVVDYFVNIGEYLSLLEASILNNGYSLVGGYCTYTNLITDNVSLQKWAPSPPKFDSNGYFNYSSTLVDQNLQAYGRYAFKQRSLLVVPPRPVLPSFKLPKVGPQVLTCAALLSNLIPRIRK